MQELLITAVTGSANSDTVFRALSNLDTAFLAFIVPFIPMKTLVSSIRMQTSDGVFHTLETLMMS